MQVELGKLLIKQMKKDPQLKKEVDAVTKKLVDKTREDLRGGGFQLEKCKHDTDYWTIRVGSGDRAACQFPSFGKVDVITLVELGTHTYIYNKYGAKTIKHSNLFDRDLSHQILTNLDGQLSFKNMNKIEWNTMSPEDKSEFFMRHVFHDGVDPRIKNEINRRVNDSMEVAKADLLKKVDNEVRTQAMNAVIKELVTSLHFEEI